MAKDFDPDKHMALAKKEAKRVAFPNIVDSESTSHETPPSSSTVEKEVNQDPQPVMIEEEPKKAKKSFFDEIG
jgi:hypothetical protein